MAPLKWKSVLPSEADIARLLPHVRFVPEADLAAHLAFVGKAQRGPFVPAALKLAIDPFAKLVKKVPSRSLFPSPTKGEGRWRHPNCATTADHRRQISGDFSSTAVCTMTSFEGGSTRMRCPRYPKSANCRLLPGNR